MRISYLYLTIITSIFVSYTLAAESYHPIELQNSPKQQQVSLYTVMNPQGVSQEEWKVMFEGKRHSITENIRYLNEFIELFNGYFKTCSPEELMKHSAIYKELFKKDLIISHPPLQIQSLDAKENIQEIIKALKTAILVKQFLTVDIEGLYNRNIGPLKAIYADCSILLKSFAPPLIPIQFAHADIVHKKGIKGTGANVIVIEEDLVSGHSFLENSPKIKVNRFTEENIGDRVSDGHGAHVTGIVHQIAPGAEIFVYQDIEEIAKNSSETPIAARIINTSYSVKIPQLHLLTEKMRIKLKGILKEFEPYKQNPSLSNLARLIESAVNNQEKRNDCIKYIPMFAKKPSPDKAKDAEETKAYEEDYANTVLKKAFQESCQDANNRIQKNIDLFKGKLRITGFGNYYNEKNWRYHALPSNLIKDEFLNQSIMVINIDRKNKLYASTNRPDHTLKEIIQNIMKENGIDDPLLVNQQLLKIQAASLCALGTDVWSTYTHDSYGWCTGTSMASPMVSGVTALIEGNHPDFSVQELRECLLNSACREFVIDTGENDLYVVDLPQYRIDVLNKENVGIRKYVAFDPSQYGQGILDADAALHYAEFKAANRSASVDELATRLNQWKRGYKSK
jgi:hypothetical protein